MRLDLIVALLFEAGADFGGVGAFAGSGEFEGAFKRAGSRVHARHMASLTRRA
jgi:hypothetical protein